MSIFIGVFVENLESPIQLISIVTMKKKATQVCINCCFDKIYILFCATWYLPIAGMTKFEEFVIEIISCELKPLSFNFVENTKLCVNDIILVFNFGSKQWCSHNKNRGHTL